MTAHLYFMARTAETTVNVKRWSLLRHFAEELVGIARPALSVSEEFKEIARELYGVAEITPATILSLCRAIAAEECENAKNTIPAVRYDSAIGYEPSMEYIGDEPYILWKLECTEKAVEELSEMLAPLM